MRAALVTSADVPGYVVTGSGGTGAMRPEQALTAGRADCRPLSDPVSARPAHRRTAYASTTFTSKEAAGGSGELDMLLLSAHVPGDAEKIMDGLAAALRNCRTFEATDGDGRATVFAVRPAEAPAAGDDAVAYVLADTAAPSDGAATVTVVRTGGSTATYVTVRLSGGTGGPPAAVVRTQDVKLRRVAAKQ
ncbi:hypothetical protein ACFYXS_37195 [Streptomyces sp. NPDC002574]|uniref:hypothetical protein n=1 Tax=Streptomyces sp. NPDC002574 TaxID=3364652 RepID=UPI0036BDAF25